RRWLSSRGASTRAGTSASPRSSSARSSGCGRSAKATESEGGSRRRPAVDPIRAAAEWHVRMTRDPCTSAGSRTFRDPSRTALNTPAGFGRPEGVIMADRPKHGAIVHVEFHVKEPKKVEKFYESLFVWKFQDRKI